jgi:hypothetical protein
VRLQPLGHLSGLRAFSSITCAARSTLPGLKISV